METLVDIFSHLCGQGRCFVVDGAALPVCQRCLGLYVGAVLTVIWLLTSGIWRRGLPSWSVFLANVVALLAGIIGGLHIVDTGATWRLTCGLWTGHVVMLWLIGGAVHLYAASKDDLKQLPWRFRDKILGMTMIGLMPILAISFESLAFLGWYFWAGLAAAGTILLAGAIVLSLFSAVRYVIRVFHPAGRLTSLAEKAGKALGLSAGEQ